VVLDVDQIDHVRGSGLLEIVEYGDYECPYSRHAYSEIEYIEELVAIRFVFRHFPLTEIHPHALAASAAAEAAAHQRHFWQMHELLFGRQTALEVADLLAYADELGLDTERFLDDAGSESVFARIRRDVESGIATGEVRGTPTLFIDGEVHRGSYEADALLEAIGA
jgi:protein-disulfide isomerase